METKSRDRFISPLDIPKELLLKYDARGPRYTSYPTVPSFKENFSSDELLSKWKVSSLSGTNDLALYIHIPFCRSRCLYCGCFTCINKTDSYVKSYVNSLLIEFEQLAEVISSNRTVKQLSFGGGTPSYLTAQDMHRLIYSLEKHFNFDSKSERSIELDPRRIDNSYLDMLIDAGFNRFSFGVQDFNPVVQKNINRKFSYEAVQKIISHLKKNGINYINIDLIYGLPGQSEDSFNDTVQKVISINPSRIALFGYAHVPWLNPHQKALEKYHMPDPKDRTAIFGNAYELFIMNGYIPIGMDHFALPDDELSKAFISKTLTRNFMGYTTIRGMDYGGTGASSISSVNDTYTQNVKDIDAYIHAENKMSWIKGLTLSREDTIRREVIMDLMCNFYLNIENIENHFNINFQDHFQDELSRLEPLQDDGLLYLKKNSINVSQIGRFFIRNIVMTFDEYLKKQQGEMKFSKTI